MNKQQAEILSDLIFDNTDQELETHEEITFEESNRIFKQCQKIWTKTFGDWEDF